MLTKKLARLVVGPTPLRGEFGSPCVTTGSASASIGPATFAGGAEALQRHGRGGGERGQLPGRFGQRGRRLAEVGEDRRAGVGEALEAAHREPELAQEAGELLQRGFQRGAAFGARLGGGAGVGEEAGHVGSLAGQRAEDRLRSRWPAGRAGRAGR